MFKFLRNVVKWLVIYPTLFILGISIILVILDAPKQNDPVTVELNEVLMIADMEDLKPAPEPEPEPEPEPIETYKHKQCRLELHKENPYGGTYNGLSNLVWDTSAFGTFDDGEVWVGYNRKVGDKLYKNLSKICK
jgi:hypothetical protein